MKEKFLKLLKDSSIYGLSNIIARSLGFLLLPLYLSYLSVEEFGILELSNSIFSILALMFLLNLDSGLFKVYYDDNSEENRRDKVNVVFTFYAIYGVILSLLLYLFSGLLSKLIFGSESYDYLFKILSLSGLFQGYVQFFLTFFRIQNKPKNYAVFNVILTFIILLLNILFVVKLGRSYQGIRESFLISHIVIFLILLFVNYKTIRFKFDYKLLKRVLLISIPLAGSGLASWVINLTDRFMLRVLLPEDIAFDQIGIYGLGGKFSLIIQMLIVVPFMMSWSNFMFKHQHDDEAKILFRKTFDILTLVSCSIFLMLILFSQNILEVLTQNEIYYQTIEIIPILVMAKLMFAIFMLFTVGVTLVEKTKYLMFSNIAGAIINIGLNFFLIPILGFVGAAITSLLANIARCIYLYFYSQKVYKIPYKIFSNSFQLILVFSVGLLITYYHFSFFTKLSIVFFSFIFVFFMNPLLLHLLKLKLGK